MTTPLNLPIQSPPFGKVLPLVWVVAGLLAACASTPQNALHETLATDASALPAQWQAPLPHGGQLTDLSRWWASQGDPVLLGLIDAAQRISPSVSAAAARIAKAQASRTGASASLLPTLNAVGSASRAPAQSGLGIPDGSTTTPGAGPSAFGGAPATTLQIGVQTTWELDFFGANRATRDAAQARLDGSRAQWHEARVLVAAEVANTYLGWRHCQRLSAVTDADAASRAETARLTGLSTQAGFVAPAQQALADASAADARARATQQRAVCDIDVKALVALTGLPEPDLKEKLASALGQSQTIAPVSIASLPAQVIAQRPDIYSAERELLAALADLDNASAQRLPRLSLSGNIGIVGYRAGGLQANGDTWSIGPLSLSVPLFDGGSASANAKAAQARVDDAASQYRAKVRQAVREVEEALVNLQSTASRSDDAATARNGYQAALVAAEARHRAGLASLIELEDTRRTALAAASNLVALERERAAAWVALYRAAGGGWQTPPPEDTLGRPPHPNPSDSLHTKISNAPGTDSAQSLSKPLQ